MALRFAYALIAAAAVIAIAPTPALAADEPVASAPIPPPLPRAPHFPTNTPQMAPKAAVAKPMAAKPTETPVVKPTAAVSHLRPTRHLVEHRTTHHANHHVVVQKETPGTAAPQPRVRMRYYADGGPPASWYARPPVAGYYVPWWRGPYAW